MADITAVRKYWDNRPCNVRHSARPIGSLAYFDEVEERKYLVEPHIPRFAEFDRWAGKRVLEVGCGIGTDTTNFARAGAHVVAVDLSPASLALAKLRASLYGQDITHLEADAEYLESYVAGRFDLIYSFGVIHHSPNPPKILAGTRRLIDPDGTLKIMVYNRHSWKALWIILRYGWGRIWKARELLAKYSEAETGCPVTHTYTRKEAVRMVEEAGYEVTDVSIDHIFPYRIRDYVRYRYVKTWYWRLVPPRVFRMLERRFGWHLMITARPV